MNSKSHNFEPLSEEIRKRVIRESKAGVSVSQITSVYHYREKSVKKIIRNFRIRRSFKRRKGAGRHKKLNQALKTAIRNKIKAFPWLNCIQFARDLNSEVFTVTVRF